LSTPLDLRNRCVTKVLERYKKRREWVVLDDVRTIIGDIERLLSSSDNMHL
jgi:hypothetical protein